MVPRAHCPQPILNHIYPKGSRYDGFVSKLVVIPFPPATPFPLYFFHFSLLCVLFLVMLQCSSIHVDLVFCLSDHSNYGFILHFLLYFDCSLFYIKLCVFMCRGKRSINKSKNESRLNGRW